MLLERFLVPELSGTLPGAIKASVSSFSRNIPLCTSRKLLKTAPSYKKNTTFMYTILLKSIRKPYSRT